MILGMAMLHLLLVMLLLVFTQEAAGQLIEQQPVVAVEAAAPSPENEASAALAPASGNSSDAAVMDRLSQQLRNPAWLANPGQPCGGNWQFVGCNEAGRVISISLSAYSQLGAIPIYLSGLTELQNLTLSSMQINGSLPANWSTAFMQLQWLDLSGNSETWLSATVCSAAMAAGCAACNEEQLVQPCSLCTTCCA